MNWKIVQNDNPYKEYSIFEYLWVDIFLNKGLLCREDLVKILKHFEINFVKKNWEETIALEEMGTALHGDVKKDTLLPFLQNYINQNYPKIFTFEEANKIYNALAQLKKRDQVINLWLSFGCGDSDASLKSFLEKKLVELTKGLESKDNALGSFDIDKDDYCQWCIIDILAQMYRLSLKANE